MNRPMKIVSADYFTSFDLNEASLEALHKKVNQPARSNHRFLRKQVLVGFAAGILLALFISLMLNKTTVDPVMQIAQEVANNHLHQKPLEIESNQLGDLQQYFKQLDFAVAPSTIYPGDESNILGGRYCSIKGAEAAQIRLKSSVRPATLYQTAYNEKLFGNLPDIDQGEQPLVRYIKGIMVKIWVEKGLLMSSAEDIH